MIKFLKKSKFFIQALILINTTSIIASEIPNQTIVKSESYFANKGDVISQLYNEDGLLIYDAIIQLIEEIENGTIDDICTDEDWYKINHFLIFLAKQGILPNATEEEKAELEKDIEETLNPYDNRISFKNSSYIDGVKIIPAICKGQPELVLCKNWFKKQCNHIGKFVKKHKTAVIVGTVVVVAAVAVVATVAIATSAAAASAAAAESCAPETKNKEVKKTEPSKSTTTAYDPVLQQSFDNQVNEYKNTIIQNDFSSSMGQNFLNKENERIIGSSLAHTAIDNIPNYLPYDNNNPIIIQGHGKTDNAFTTNQSPLYFNDNIAKTPNSIQENVFYLQGEQALKNNYYDQAITHFGKAIEVNPSNHNIYLDRAYAHLQNGQFDQSLNDYKFYTSQSQTGVEKPAPFVDCFDFTFGVTTGITKGAVESGKQLMSFAANAITHPVKIYSGFVNSIQMLSNLAKDNEWTTLSKILFPEICELVNNLDSLTPKEKGEISGYIIGKYGADILIPGAAAKAVAQGIKGAKELVVTAKNIQRTEELIVLEALAETGGSGAFKEVVYFNKVFESAASTGKIIEGFSVKQLSNAGKVFDRGGLTKAGRALAKHGGRESSVFTKPKGNPSQINLHGQEILENILNHPNKKIYRYTFKEYGEIIDIKVLEIGGLRYNTKGELLGFLEP